MSLWRAVAAGVHSLFQREVKERELDDELRHYLDMAISDKVRHRGMSPEDARRSTLLEMGGIEPVKSRVRWGGWEGSLEWLRQDVRVAARGLRRTPGFTAVAVISLALGVGAVTTMFTVVNAVMFRPLPYHDADRLVMIYTDDTRRGLHREQTAMLTVADWRARNGTLRDVAWFTNHRIAPIHPDGSRGRTRNTLVSPNLFALLGAAPLHGRLISAADEREPVAVISHGFWRRWFDGAPDVVGRTLLVDDAARGGATALTVIGVLPQDFYFPDRITEVFTPAATSAHFDRESAERFQPSARRWTALARLNATASPTDARDDLNRIGARLAAAHPTAVPDFPGFAVTVLPVLDTIAGANVRASLWLLLGAVGVVLLVVCANLANLLLARGATRHREFAVRRALGAGRGRLARQLVVESMVLVLAGGATGVVVAAAATPILASSISAYVPRMDEIALDARVLVFAAAASVLAGLIFGVGPALRLSAARASEALREGGRGTAGGRLRRSHGVMVLAECALALVVLAFAGLLLKSLNRLQSVEPGFDPHGVLTMRLEFPSQVSATGALNPAAAAAQTNLRARAQVAHAIAERVAAVPGVASTGFVDDMFVAGRGNASIVVPGREGGEIAAGELAEALATPGFFTAMRVPLRLGRLPTSDDAALRIQALRAPATAGRPLAEQERLAIAEPVVVNEAFARRFFRGENPLGRRFLTDPTHTTHWYEIVGVVGDMHRGGLERAPIPEYYRPWIPSGGGRVDLVVRAVGDPLALVPLVRQAVVLEVPAVSIASVSTAEQQLGAFTTQRRLQTTLLALFAALALVLSAIGIFGVAHYAVAERTREIGVRVALGASPGDVLRLMIGQGMRMPAAGIAVGIVVSLAVTRVISHQLFGVEPTDPATFAAVAAVLAAVAAFACYLAARRAAHADPIMALRQD